MEDNVIHTWENGNKLYTDGNGDYILSYNGEEHKLTVVNTGFGYIVLCSDDEVPKGLLQEISVNIK